MVGVCRCDRQDGRTMSLTKCLNQRHRAVRPRARIIGEGRREDEMATFRVSEADAPIGVKLDLSRVCMTLEKRGGCPVCRTTENDTKARDV